MFDEFSIENSTNTTNFKVTLTDILEKSTTVFSNKNLYDVSLLNSGTYFIRIEDNVGTKKSLKNKKLF
jgi:hypothetical protein